MPKPILYSTILSPPCRAVLLTAKVIGLELDVHEMNLLNKDNLKEDFLKINPQHTLPTLDDNGFILWDSHAIIRYLVGKYAKNDSLYPKDLQQRAIIDQRLHFEGDIIFVRSRNTLAPIFFLGEKSFNKESLKKIQEGLSWLNQFLENKKWLAGNNYTLADISCCSTVAGLPALVSLEDYPNIIRWLKTCEKEIPGYKECNLDGAMQLQAVIKQMVQ